MVRINRRRKQFLTKENRRAEKKELLECARLADLRSRSGDEIEKQWLDNRIEECQIRISSLFE